MRVFGGNVLKKRKKLNTRRLLKVVLFFGIMVYIGISLINQSYTLARVNQEKENLIKQIEEQQIKQNKIEATKQEYNSDEYIERIAREKLGFVRMNEIIFVDSSSN